MRLRNLSILLGAAAFAASVSATPPQIGPNVRVNAVPGPDATVSTVDDDDPNDQSFVKAQNSTTATVIRSEGDPILFGAWNDRSWYDLPSQDGSNDYSVGFGADDLSLSWPFHDIARGGDEEPDDLPYPTGDGPDYWQELQTTAKAAVIPPQSSVAGIYLVGEDEGEDGQRLWIAHSPDGAASWSTITAVWNAYDPNDPDTRDPSLTVWKDDPNDPEVHMLLTWTEVPVGPQEGNSFALFSISDDSGETFTTPARMSDPDLPPDYAGDAGWSASAVGPGPGGGDFVYVVWFQDQGISEIEEVGVPALKWRRYSVDAQTWSPQTGTNGSVVADIIPVGDWIPGNPSTAPLNFYLYDQASVVVDHSPGRISTVYVAFSQIVLYQDPYLRFEPDVFVATLRPGASDFEAPVKVNDDPLIPFGTVPNTYMPTIQFMPWVAMTDQGHVGVGWYDRRDHVDEDPNDFVLDMNRKHHYYFAYSIDGGRNFSDNVRVSEEQSDPVPAEFDITDMGAYTSIGGVYSSFMPLWIDLRDWEPQDNHPDRLGDVYSAEIRICEGNAPDADNDCDVDLTDFAVFAQCFSASPLPAWCLTWDFDFDGDVDLTDYAVYSHAFTGSQTPCDWGCQEESLNVPSLEDLLENEEIQALYEELEAYCEENGIPFT